MFTLTYFNKRNKYSNKRKMVWSKKIFYLINELSKRKYFYNKNKSSSYINTI